MRILACWRSNEAVRVFGFPLEKASSSERDENLRALLRLLDETDENQLLLKAEVHRELGMWKEAQEALARVTSQKYSSVVTQIRILCQAQDACVRELKFRA